MVLNIYEAVPRMNVCDMVSGIGPVRSEGSSGARNYQNFGLFGLVFGHSFVCVTAAQQQRVIDWN